MNTCFTILVCAVLATASAAINKEKVNEVLQILHDASETCNTDPATYEDKAGRLNWYNGGEKPANLGAHVFCVTKFIGWQYKDGSLNQEKLQKLSIDFFGDTECNHVLASSEATAENLILCFKKHAV